jgi:hypothetical protein
MGFARLRTIGVRKHRVTRGLWCARDDPALFQDRDAFTGDRAVSEFSIVSTATPLCPSADPGVPGCVAIGVVLGSADEPRLRQFESPLPVSDDLLAMAAPARPTEVFRFAAPCSCGACPNFHGDRCGLVTKIVRLVPAVTAALPNCLVRPQCRWWQEEGKAACLRCPAVVTDNASPSPLMRLASDPSTTIPILPARSTTGKQAVLSDDEEMD